MYPNLAELSSLFISTFLIESILGRKLSMIFLSVICFFFTGLTMMIIKLNIFSFYFWTLSSISRCSIDVSFIILITYSLESYPTYLRINSAGLIYALSDTMCIFMPYILDFLMSVKLYLPYLLFCILMSLNIFILIFMKKDKRNAEIAES